MQILIATLVSLLKTEEIRKLNLFKTTDQLLQRKEGLRYPTSTSSERLADEFASFFHEKISKMRCSLSNESESILTHYLTSLAVNRNLWIKFFVP